MHETPVKLATVRSRVNGVCNYSASGGGEPVLEIEVDAELVREPGSGDDVLDDFVESAYEGHPLTALRLLREGDVADVDVFHPLGVAAEFGRLSRILSHVLTLSSGPPR